MYIIRYLQFLFLFLIKCVNILKKIYCVILYCIVLYCSGVAQRIACWAHNPKVVGSNPTPANIVFLNNISLLRRHWCGSFV